MNENVASSGQSESRMIYAEQVRLLYVNSPQTLIGVVAVSAFTCLMFWNESPRELLLSWFAANVGLSAIRWITVRKFYSRFNPKESNTFHWAIIYSGGALTSGLLWGILPWLILDASSVFNTLSISVIIFGMTSAAVGSHSSYPVAYFCYAIPAAGLLAIRFAVEGEGFLILAILMFAFLLANLSYSIGQNRLIKTSITRRFENLELMHNLDLKRAEAEKANADKSRFLAATSHDLRQPLHALDLYLGALKTELTEEKHKQILLSACQSSLALSELLNALMDVSHLDAGKVKVNRCAIQLQTIMQQIADEWQLQYAEQGRVLRLKYQTALVDSDPVLLMRLLRNLISNAMRHTEGDVLIGTRKRGEFIRVDIWDQGDGLKESDQEMIFSEFYQLNNPERDRTKGLGLGLPIVDRISRLLDHPITVKSRMGKGSRFSVKLPLLAIDAKSNITDAYGDVDISGIFVLVVDDEAIIRDGMQMLLRSWDCEVLTAGSGKEALHELRTHTYPAPDILVVDYRLRNKETGVQVAEQISQLFNSKIPTLIISGDTNPELDEICEEKNYTLLRKPVESGHLKAEIASLSIIERKKA